MNDAKVTRGRRRAIYALVTFCVVFFVGGIATSYAVAANYGYGTGFGDGRPQPVGEIHGHGFFGDAAIVAGAFAVDALVLSGWYWLVSRLEAPTEAERPAPDLDTDPLSEESWYAVAVPTLTKVLTVLALFCLTGVATLASLNLPIVLIRFGW
jgi:hypothetical protein